MQWFRREVGSESTEVDSMFPRPSQPDVVTAEESGEETVLPAAYRLAFPEH